MSPLDIIQYDQSGAYLPIKIMPNDDLPGIVIGIPFVITDYTFDGEIFDYLGSLVTSFTISTTQSTPTGIIKLSLTKVQTAMIPLNATYRVRWTESGTIRTFLYGTFEVVNIW